MEVGEMVNTVLFVDDETNILKALKRVFMDKPFEITTVASPVGALGLFERTRVAVVVSDQRMPEMEGTAFLEKVKSISPDTVRIMLTGYADLDAAVAAINRGSVHRYLQKPWNEDELRLAVAQGVELYRLTTENRRLLELTKVQNQQLLELNADLEGRVKQRTQRVEALLTRLRGSFHKTIKLFVDLMEMYNPVLGRHVKQVAELSRRTAERLGLEANSIELTETAALLHDIGLIGFSRKLMDKEYNQLEKQEWAHLSLNPVIAYDFLNKIDDLGDVSVIVRSVHEAFDGSGYPDRLKGDEIPIEARIIRLANDYEILIDKKKATKREALKEFHRTDPILDHLFVRQVVQA